jgi:DNA-binding LacI/PurR family transcriptional regulator
MQIATTTNHEPVRSDAELRVPIGRRLQMADIARMAGVSTTTVSRALSGSALVNKATRKRVTELAQSLNYTVNAGAKELRLGQSNTVAVVVTGAAGPSDPLADPFQLLILGSIAGALAERGLDMLVTRVDEENLRHASTPYDSGRARGVILVGSCHNPEALNQLVARGVPLVAWGPHAPGQMAAAVACDDVTGGRLATEHLLSRERLHIAFLGETSRPEVALRLEGYRQALTGAGVALDDAKVVSTATGADGVRKALAKLRAQLVPFDALFCADDALALAAINALRDGGQRVPQDVAVVGYGDGWPAALAQPALTTVRHPLEKGGRALVAALLSPLERNSQRVELLPAELVLRTSA